MACSCGVEVYCVDDPQTGDTICTTCGVVVGRENSLMPGFGDSGEPIRRTENSLVARVVRALELEPEDEWIDVVTHRLPTNKPTCRRVCAALLAEDARLYERMHAIGLPVVRVTPQVAQDFRHETTFVPWIRRYLGHVVDSPDKTRALSRLCEDIVRRTPELRFVLPGLFVVAAYARMVGAHKTAKKDFEALVSGTGLHVASVKRILKKILIT